MPRFRPRPRRAFARSDRRAPRAPSPLRRSAIASRGNGPARARRGSRGAGRPAGLPRRTRRAGRLRPLMRRRSSVQTTPMPMTAPMPRRVVFQSEQIGLKARQFCLRANVRGLGTRPNVSGERPRPLELFECPIALATIAVDPGQVLGAGGGERRLSAGLEHARRPRQQTDRRRVSAARREPARRGTGASRSTRPTPRDSGPGAGGGRRTPAMTRAPARCAPRARRSASRAGVRGRAPVARTPRAPHRTTLRATARCRRRRTPLTSWPQSPSYRSIARRARRFSSGESEQHVPPRAGDSQPSQEHRERGASRRASDRRAARTGVVRRGISRSHGRRMRTELATGTNPASARRPRGQQPRRANP